MPKISTFSDAQRALEPYLGTAQDVQAAYTLERVEKLLDELGNPQEKLRVVHVAGTSGKTSTCYYVASLLKETGVTVGLTVSPHIDTINERLQVDLVPLNEVAYCAALQEFLELLKTMQTVPSYFELLIAFAYWYFAKIEVDYAVVEVGLGGLLDSTNTTKRRDKVCIITDIGLDHTKILGSTINEIATQKAGIIHLGNHVFCYRQTDEINAVISNACEQKRATLHRCEPRPEQVMIETIPLFQRRNWQLAAQTFEYVVERDGLAALTFDQWQNSQTVYIPGRMEIIHIEGKTLILDGAHNPQKMTALAESVKELVGGQEIAALVAFRESKDAQESLKILSSVAITLYATSPTVPRARNMNFQTLPELAEHAEIIQTFPDSTLALEALMNRPEPYLLVTGSFYLIHDIKKLLAAKQPTDSK